ncbi:hypothetical protein H5410_048743 [Solanum commersonii]|uniref:Uncharacterized protein n=1 Tax=Solanum commersonii TaxID=4109 RepID=A0A9J5XKH1_SOLCO|nr:hypothetical protein H5410_048743 [Solanum commersonii]
MKFFNMLLGSYSSLSFFLYLASLWHVHIVRYLTTLKTLDNNENFPNLILSAKFQYGIRALNLCNSDSLFFDPECPPLSELEENGGNNINKKRNWNFR